MPPRALPDSFHLHGRLAVRYGAEGFSGGLDWRHSGREDEMLLRSPLGQTVARFRRDGSGASLEVPDGRHEGRDAGDLSQQVLGWRLPLEGLPYWVAGRAAPDGPAQVERGGDGRVTRLRQEEWDVTYPDYRPQDGYFLPSRVVMRNGALVLKLVVDNWELP